MSLQSVEIYHYNFSEFGTIEKDKTVRIKVTPTSRSVSAEEDKEAIKLILNDIGKWENLTKTGSLLLSELGIIQPDQTMIQNYDEPSGIELYDVEFNVDDSLDFLWLFISFADEEEANRENAKLNIIPEPEKIKAQIVNIPKWKALKKTIKVVQEELL
jgi:hypothetical protein